MSLPKAALASLRVMATAFKNAASLCTTRIPRPPPPPEAFTITGKPIFFAVAKLALSSLRSGPSEPGTVGTPAVFMAFFAEILSPNKRIDSALGPIKINPLDSTCSAKSARSDKKP